MPRIKLIIIALFFSVGLLAQDSVLGKWKTIDDKTGREKAVVDIYMRDGKLYGKIIKTFPKPGQRSDPICDKCTGEDKDKPIIGMEIIRGLSQDDDTWEDGTILDAEEGKTYTCKLWEEDGILKVRGYIAFFYRTQEWIRYSE